MPPVTRRQTGSLRPARSTSDNARPAQLDGHKPRQSTRRNRKSNAAVQHHDDIDTSDVPACPNQPLELPRFTINLSLPPEQRYTKVCDALRTEMRELESLFDEVVGGVLSWLPTSLLRWVCWALLWRVSSDEENAELKGISKATGIDMYLLVCFNIILDLLMGCSSGGAAVSDAGSASYEHQKMVHFRTLDWGMPSLRHVLVQLDFVLEAEGEVVASSITYAGFVGVLTGVRKGLSMSLNFRGVHDNSERFMADLRYYVHLGLVLFGLRPSISSLLRGYLIPEMADRSKSISSGANCDVTLPSYEQVVRTASCHDKPLLSTACYLCFSSGYETTVIEKDLATARLRRSGEFIVVTNADTMATRTDNPSSLQKPSGPSAVAGEISPMSALDELIEDANERKACAEQNYQKLVRRRSRYSRDRAVSKKDVGSTATLPTTEDIVTLVQTYPTTNECTHFATVLDPLEGAIAWCRYWKAPIEEHWAEI